MRLAPVEPICVAWNTILLTHTASAQYREALEKAYIILVVGQNPREDGVLHEVVVRPTSQGVELHQVLEVGHLSILAK